MCHPRLCSDGGSVLAFAPSELVFVVVHAVQLEASVASLEKLFPNFLVINTKQDLSASILRSHHTTSNEVFKSVRPIVKCDAGMGSGEWVLEVQGSDAQLLCLELLTRNPFS
jgi:hypothetical protein